MIGRRCVLLVMVLGACGAPTSASRRDSAPQCAPRPPAGSPSMMTTRSGPRDQSGFMVTVTPPESCKGSTYVGVHGSGARRLVFPRQGTCKGQPAPGDRCDRVEAHEFAADVQAHLVRTVGAIEIGKGLGGCGQPGGEVFDDTGAGSWAFVIHLQDWAYADAALATIAERMSAWDVGSTFGISVDSTMCAVSGSDT